MSHRSHLGVETVTVDAGRASLHQTCSLLSAKPPFTFLRFHFLVWRHSLASFPFPCFSLFSCEWKARVGVQGHRGDWESTLAVDLSLSLCFFSVKWTS